jgi:hypothetical protein
MNYELLCNFVSGKTKNKQNMSMKKLIFLALLSVFFLKSSAQVETPKETPQLEFVMQLKVTIGEAYSCGETQHGQRTIIPITGGTFEGPRIKGTILSGGADYQLANTIPNRTELEAIYCIKTDDGVCIHIRNKGIIANGKDEKGKPSFYFKCAPQFEAPADSKYAWLNNALFICSPDWTQQFKGIILNVWQVK